MSARPSGFAATASASSISSRATLDPALQPLAQHVVDQIEAAMVKVAAHHADPAAFPLPSAAKSFEQVLAKRWRKLSPARQQVVARQLGARAALRPVGGQPAKAPLGLRTKLSATALKRLAADRAALPRLVTEKLALFPGRPAAEPLPELAHLELRVHAVRCVDDTREAAKDEIAIGAVLTNITTNSTTNTAVNQVGSFRTGDTVTFSNPLRFPSFDLRQGDVFPKDYIAILAMAEQDMGGFAAFLDEFVEAIQRELEALLTAMLAGVAGGATAGAVGGPLGALLGALVGAVVVLGVALLKRLWGDEIFEPQPVTPVTITSLTDRFAGGATESSPETALFFGFGGHFEVTYSWRMF